MTHEQEVEGIFGIPSDPNFFKFSFPGNFEKRRNFLSEIGENLDNLR